MFKRLKIYYVFISLPYLLLLAGAVIFSNGIKYTLVRNPHPQINYTIFTIILVGGVIILLNSKRLISEAKTVLDFFGNVRDKKNWEKLQDLATRYRGETSCLMQMIASSGGRFISHQEQVAIENELANARSSILRRNTLPSYLTGLLVGMGLLGTFIGLLATLNDISVLISSFGDLDMKNASPLVIFRTMIERMKAPMQSMGIAFSASMFGLLGSIVLGLMMVGVRRLQGDMFSVLSSEVARHIETALSHENVVSESFQRGTQETGMLTNVLVRLEERYIEAVRSQQKTFGPVMHKLQEQNADLKLAVQQQTESNSKLLAGLALLERHFNALAQNMGKGAQNISEQLSELAIGLSTEAKETHKLLSKQINEQTQLNEKLDSYQVQERLAEGGRLQQREFLSVVSQLEQSWHEMLHSNAQQNEWNDQAQKREERLSNKLDAILCALNDGREELSSQMSELTVHVAADTRQNQLEMEAFEQFLWDKWEKFSKLLKHHYAGIKDANEGLAQQISEMSTVFLELVEKSIEHKSKTHVEASEKLQWLGNQLDLIASVTKSGHSDIASRLSELSQKMFGEPSSSQQKIKVVNNRTD